MFGTAGFSLALIGSALAGLYDLKTTEIPDEISLGMIASGLVLHLVQSLWTGNPIYFFQSAATGCIFFTFGFLMYMGGQWGGGDAKVLTGVGTLLPVLPLFATVESLLAFPIAFFVNLFLVGAVYIIVYAFVHALRCERVPKEFLSSLRKERREFAVFTALISVVSLFLFYVFSGEMSYVFLFLIPAAVSLFLLGKFLKTVEDVGFVREIDTADLEVGDMLAEETKTVDEDIDHRDEMREASLVFSFFVLLPLTMYFFNYTESIYFLMATVSGLFGLGLALSYLIIYKLHLLRGLKLFRTSSGRIRGLNESEVKKIREEKETVRVRGGVRFAPAFPMAILFTVYIGDIFLLLI
ncbi:MAG: prepilin peptidase [Candidatus Aenigmatarchaeota archaeon]